MGTRTRRRDKKKKKATKEDEAAPAPPQDDFCTGADFIPLEELGGSQDKKDTGPAFFGVLDQQQSQYFTSVNQTLAAGVLGAVERAEFTRSVCAEARGQELKLATSPVGSQLLERLAEQAEARDVVALLHVLAPEAWSLACDQFASHAIEALLARAAAVAGEDAVKPEEKERTGAEQAVLAVANAVNTHLKAMVSKPYAASVLRSLLLVLYGEPLLEELHSRRSRAHRMEAEIKPATKAAYVTPTSFDRCIASVIATFEWDAAKARELGLDPVSSPVIQAILKAEARRHTFRTYELIFTGASKYINHCLADPVGSHLLQAAIESLPRARLETRFVEQLRSQLPTAAESTTGAFIATALLRSRLPSKKELVEDLVPRISHVLKAGRPDVVEHLLAVARKISPRTTVDAITDAITEHYGGTLNLYQKSNDRPRAQLFAELCRSPALLTRVAHDACRYMDSETLRAHACDPVRSHALQVLLNPSVDIVDRRKMVAMLAPISVDLARNAYGSHIVDALAKYCFHLKFARERVADDLARHEEELKNSPYGRLVWRNWHLDKYKHQRREWWILLKTEEDELAKTLNVEKPQKRPRDTAAATDAKPPDSADKKKHRSTK